MHRHILVNHFAHSRYSHERARRRLDTSTAILLWYRRRGRQDDVTTPREPASRFLRVSCFKFNSLAVDGHVYDWALTDFGRC